MAFQQSGGKPPFSTLSLLVLMILPWLCASLRPAVKLSQSPDLSEPNMAKEKGPKSIVGQQSTGAAQVSAPKNFLSYLFARSNRGLLLDIVVFIGNIFLIRFLTRLYIGVFNEVSAQNPLAMLAIGLTFLAMWILPATGAVLKRWNFHRRMNAEGRKVGFDEIGLAGCLFNPLFYFA